MVRCGEIGSKVSSITSAKRFKVPELVLPGGYMDNLNAKTDYIINTIGPNLLAAQNFTELKQLSLDYARELFKPRITLAVLLINREGSLEIADSFGIDPASLNLIQPDSLVAAAIEREQTIYVPNTSLLPEQEFRFLVEKGDRPYSEAVYLSTTKYKSAPFKTAGLNAVMVSPLKANDRIYGALAVASDMALYFDKGTDILLCSQLASRIALGLASLEKRGLL